MKPNLEERVLGFAVRVVRLFREALVRDDAGRIIGAQLLRAGTSVGANVEEAQAAHSKRDFIAKMTIAQKESRETAYWLKVIAASGIVTPRRIASPQDEAEQLKRIISAIVVTARRREGARV